MKTLATMLLVLSSTVLADTTSPSPAEKLRQLQALDMAAYAGSRQAAWELCRLESQNRALEYNPTKADFWCAQARQGPTQAKVARP